MIVLYFWAPVHKLNTGFLDPAYLVLKLHEQPRAETPRERVGGLNPDACMVEGVPIRSSVLQANRRSVGGPTCRPVSPVTLTIEAATHHRGRDRKTWNCAGPDACGESGGEEHTTPTLDAGLARDAAREEHAVAMPAEADADRRADGVADAAREVVDDRDASAVTLLELAALLTGLH